MYQYKVDIIRVIDGDTVTAQLDLGFHVFVHQTLRLHGIDSPEIKGESREKGLEAKEFLKSLIESYGPLFVTTIKDRGDKYGRYLAVIHGKNGENLNHLMVENGHAKPFMP